MSDRFSSHISAQRSCPNGKRVLLVDEDCGEWSSRPDLYAGGPSLAMRVWRLPHRIDLTLTATQKERTWKTRSG